jgi:hypothetical protein
VSSLGTLRRDRDWDLPQEAVQAVANVFLVMAEVGQEGAECVMDEDQFVMCEFESGHAKKAPLRLPCRTGTEVIGSTLLVTMS